MIRIRLSFVTLATLLASCSLLNDIDVCERTAPTEHEINRLTDGAQVVGSDRAIGVLNGTRAMVFFTSYLPDESESEIRGAVVRADGTSVPTCGEEHERTFAASSAPTLPVFAGPVENEETGLLVYAGRAGAVTSLFGQYVSSAGCPVGDPVIVGQETVNETLLENPAVVAQGGGAFLVTWTAFELVSGLPVSSLRARVLLGNSLIGQLRFALTAPAPDGSVAKLAKVRTNPRGVAAAMLRREVALAWYEVGLSVSVNLGIYSRDLERSSVRTIDDTSEAGIPGADFPEPLGLSLAFDGEQILVAWLRKDLESGGTRLYARFFAPDGQPLSAPDAPRGQAIRLGGSSAQRNPAVTALESGGFLVVWEEDGADASGSGIRGVVFAPDGSRRFVNPACDNTAFGLNHIEKGDQTRPSVVALRNGTLLTAWTDSSQSGGDISSSSVRVLAQKPRDLFPVD